MTPLDGLKEARVVIEPELRNGLVRRVFRRMPGGALEWAAYDDWQRHHERARFYGYFSRELPASIVQSEEAPNA